MAELGSMRRVAVHNAEDEVVGRYMTPCPVTVEFDQTLAEASSLMSEHAVRHLPVLRGGGIVGVLSDRDVAVVESLASTPAERVRVVEAMTPVPYAIPANTPLLRVVQRMAAEKYGCAIVTDDTGKAAIGIFTTTDALLVLTDILAVTTARELSGP